MLAPGGIWCECGCRVTVHDVLQHGFVMSQWVPEFVYVKYRCPECGAVGELVMEFESWDASILDAPSAEPTPAELDRFEQLGDISPHEIIDFAQQLRTASTEALEGLRADG